jgi:5-methylcytosine-specific restriction endonuclease McrA
VLGFDQLSLGKIMNTSLQSDLIKSIHQTALEVASRFRQSEFDLIEIIQQADQHRVHYSLGYSSLFKYVTDGLKLSEEIAYIFINVARKAREVPALKEEIKRGAITVSKAKRICSVINASNQNRWLELAKNSSKRELEKQVAAASPRDAVRDKMDYVHESNEVKERARILSLGDGTATRVQLQVGISEKLMIELRRNQDLLSQKMKRPASLEELFQAMAQLYRERHDPVRKAERQKIKGKLPVVSSDRLASPVAGRRPLKAGTRHHLMLKHSGQCSHHDSSGQRCSQRRHLEIHHIKPLSEGGTDALDNLTLLCFGHHRGLHL